MLGQRWNVLAAVPKGREDRSGTKWKSRHRMGPSSSSRWSLLTRRISQACSSSLRRTSTPARSLDESLHQQQQVSAPYDGLGPEAPRSLPAQPSEQVALQT